MPKQYSYQFGYYWKIVWPDNATFKSDSQNYRGFKQRVKREFKIINEDNVILYLNLRWTTTLGKIRSLFPSSTSIEVSSADEFKEVKDNRELKTPSKKISKVKRNLEPSDEFCLRVDSVQENGRIRLVKNDRKRTYRQSMMETEEIQNGKSTFKFENGTKKIHTEEDTRSTESTEDENRSPKVLESMFAKGECEANSVSDAEIYHTDKKFPNQMHFPMRQVSSIEDENEFRWESGLLPDLCVEDLHVPTKIRNFGIENSINPIYWENEFQDNFSFGML